MKLQHSALILVLVGLSVVQPAHAYIDAGTGSMLAQLAVGGFAGIVVVARIFLRRLFARGKKGNNKK